MHHWDTGGAPPTSWLWGSSLNALCALTRRNPHYSFWACWCHKSRIVWIPPSISASNPCSAALSHMPSWFLPLSPPSCYFPASLTRSPPLQLVVQQGTCKGQWGNPESATCKPPRVGFRWPYSPKMLQNSAVALYLPPKTASASVGGWPSQSLWCLWTVAVVSRQKPPSCLWCPPVWTPEVFLRRPQSFPFLQA